MNHRAPVPTPTGPPQAVAALHPPRIRSLALEGITKRFPGVIANNNVSFDVQAGEIHALLGENGAGKSTLMKILYGLYQPDAGQIRLNDAVITIHSPLDAIGHGIGMIHQHFMLVPELTVVENVALGLRSTRGIRLDLERVAARITTLAAGYGLQVDPFAQVGQLAVGEQQRVEIIKALYRGADLLVLDEPTAVLTPQEVDDLFRTLKQMRAAGHALIFISHKLHEIIDLCDRVTVLRQGAVVGTHPVAGMSRDGLARMMVGRAVQLERPADAGPPPDYPSLAPLLRVRHVTAHGERGTLALQDVGFDAYPGEILGVAGVSGNGQRELAEVLAGLRALDHGQIVLGGTDITAHSSQRRMHDGVAYIPEERMRDGVVLSFNVAENVILRDHEAPPYARWNFLRLGAIHAVSRRLIDVFRVKTPSSQTTIKNLSGGNIQKVIMARELSRTPRLLIAAQPTRGVDIGASEYIHQILRERRAAGAAIILISEDLDEILKLADRVAVMFAGRIMDILPHHTAVPERIGLLMAGVQPNAG
ncbi:MAG: ABC transporter ATP-binding protein [Chloroflexaceae bacterium]|nr:ABC transporter ATP-binding protein [Chloroflexaceae bacterium]